MVTTRTVLSTFTIGLLAAGAGEASGQTYPNKPLRIVTTGAGGGNDTISRLIAPGLAASLGQPLIVENRPSQVIAADTVAKAPSDGYTLLLTSQAIWIAPLLEKMPYDPVRDFSPITLVTMEPSVLAVHTSVAANSVKELIALAKAKPGSLNYATSGAGTSAHLVTELFKAMAGVNIVRINYSGGGAMLNALLGEEVQMGFISASAIGPHIKSNRLRALGVTSLQPSALAPGLPSIAAFVPGFEMVGITAIFAPAATPTPIINRLNAEIVRLINRPETKEKLLNGGQEIVGGSPEELAVKIKSDTAIWGKLIKDAGIKIQ